MQLAVAENLVRQLYRTFRVDGFIGLDVVVIQPLFTIATFVQRIAIDRLRRLATAKLTFDPLRQLTVERRLYTAAGAFFLFLVASFSLDKLTAAHLICSSCENHGGESLTHGPRS